MVRIEAVVKIRDFYLVSENSTDEELKGILRANMIEDADVEVVEIVSFRRIEKGE